MIKRFININEIYAFFVPNLVKPPQKPRTHYISGMQLDRAGWHICTYHRPIADTLHIWFYSHPDRAPKWSVTYDKFTNPSQES